MLVCQSNSHKRIHGNKGQGLHIHVHVAAQLVLAIVFNVEKQYIE